ncbi:MAG: protein kinase [Anaerolineae bacterium]|nr:protein kinase [Anaerolineae bacterium]
MECPYCHHQNRDTARFCAGCGNPLTPVAVQMYVALQPGQVLHGQYRVVRAIGKGGMGAVYLVEDLGAFGRYRVVKEMLQYYDLTRPEEVQAAHRRFEAEGRTLAQLRHPGIPDIIAYFSEGGRNYIVMEYVEGPNLAEGLTRVDAQGNLVRGRPYPVEEVLRWGIQLCDVLIYLSEQNPPVVHHDIKPANIIIDRATGDARLVDFGTAKARLVVQPGGRVGVRQSSIYGTEGYAAPEMYQGESSPRSDIYSLGATLYHLLTDDDPRDHPFAFPKLDTLHPSLRAVLRGTLQEDPQARPDARGLKEALKGVQEALAGRAQAPFFFPDGKMARTPAELARLCDERWAVAKDLLYKGDLEDWLRRSLFRTDLADQAAAIVRRISDQDEGLEQFLHVLNPKLPYPSLKVHPRALRFGRIPPGGQAQRTLHIRNRARRGVLKGTIVADPPVPWLSLPSQFRGEGTVTVTVETGNIPKGTPLVTHLRLKTIYQPQEVTIPVRGQVAFPWPRVLARMAQAIGVGALVGTGLAFLGTAPPGSLSSALGIALLALLLVFRRRPSGRSWVRRAARALFATLFYAGLLLSANCLGYSAWTWVRQADPLAARTLPIGIGALVGLALGIPRALERPGRPQAFSRLLAALILLISSLYLGLQAYPGLRASPTGPLSSAPSPTSTSLPPTRPPTPTATPLGEFAVGMEVEVATSGARLNIRESPGTGAPIVAKVEPGTRLRIVDGPRRADGYTWWQVRLPDGTLGWAVEKWLKPVR